jgi:hypothetical protein
MKLPLFLICLMARAQTPVEVHFQLISMGSHSDTGIPGEKVRLILGDAPGWQNATAGHAFVTDEKGEAVFTMDAKIDKIFKWQNVGFTPIRVPVRAEHLQIGVELPHRFPLENGGFADFRWVLTMDVDRLLSRSSTGTVGFMGIYTPDEHGNFTKPLRRDGTQDAWFVPALNNRVIRGLRYNAVDWSLLEDEKNPNRRMLNFAVKREPERQRK